MTTKKTNLEKMINEFGKRADESRNTIENSQPTSAPFVARKETKEKEEKTKGSTIVLPESLWKRLKLFAVETDTSMSAIIRELIENKLEEEGR